MVAAFLANLVTCQQQTHLNQAPHHSTPRRLMLNHVLDGYSGLSLCCLLA